MFDQPLKISFEMIPSLSKMDYPKFQGPIVYFAQSAIGRGADEVNIYCSNSVFHIS